ncbi:MAG: hypothetical protein V9H69_08105 [Anaerolineae bacterium]
MISQAAKELFALLNAFCGGLLVLGLLLYLLRSRPRRTSVIILLGLLIGVSFLNAWIVYSLL